MAVGSPYAWTRVQVHRWHRRLRRERLERRAAGGPDTDPARRELERQLGRLRDLDLLIDFLAEAPEAGEGQVEGDWRQRTLRALAIRRAAAASEAPLPPTSPSEPIRGPGDLPGATRRLDRDIARALDRPTAKRVHAVRQAIRRIEAARTVMATRKRTYVRPGRVARLMSALGRVHDLDRAVDQLETLPECAPRDAWIGRGRTDRSRRWRSARRRLRRSSAKKLFSAR